MKLIPKLCPKLDFAILPIGDNFTMGVDEALMASDFIKCKNNRCHFNTFPPIKINVSSAVKKFSFDKKKLIIPELELLWICKLNYVENKNLNSSFFRLYYIKKVEKNFI